MLERWTFEIVLVLVVVQLLVFFVLYRRSIDPEHPDSMGNAPSATDDGNLESITCRECGTENDAEYRYCRQCVSDLSAESISGYRTHSPSERSL